jgi:hypothetical protein
MAIKRVQQTEQSGVGREVSIGMARAFEAHAARSGRSSLA